MPDRHLRKKDRPDGSQVRQDPTVTGGRRARIVAALADSTDGLVTAVGLCRVFRDITGMSGAGIMLMSGDMALGSVGTTGAVSAMIDDLQFTLGEGPSVDAYALGRPVLEPDLAHPARPRWLAFTGAAIDAGVRAVFGFPMDVGSARVGALNLYADHPGTLSDDQLADAMVSAQIAAGAVLAMQARTEADLLVAEREVGSTSGTWSTRRQGWSPPSST